VPPDRTADQRPRVCLTGGAAATGHGAPQGATESSPGVVTDRPWICRPVDRGRRKRPRSATTFYHRLDRPPFRGPFLHTLRARIGSSFVKKCSGPNLSSQRAFFCMGNEHKKPVGAPAGVDGQSHLLRGDGVGGTVLGRRCRLGQDGTVGSVEHDDLDLDLVVASRPVPRSAQACVINRSIARSAAVQDRWVKVKTWDGRPTSRGSRAYLFTTLTACISLAPDQPGFSSSLTGPVLPTHRPTDRPNSAALWSLHYWGQAGRTNRPVPRSPLPSPSRTDDQPVGVVDRSAGRPFPSP
jgi:hypothetical protein